MRYLFVDIETRGSVPVTTHGLYRHAEDPDLRLLCVSYALGEEPVKTWRCAFHGGDPAKAEPMPFDLWDALMLDSFMLVAWNAAYERVVLNAVLRRYGFVHKIPIERTLCAAAWAAAHNLPRSLEDCAAQLLDEDRRKSSAGKQTDWMWSTQAPLLPEHRDFYEVGQVDYCQRDVEAMRWIWECLTEPTEQFLREYHAAERVNDAGMLFDVELIDAAIELAPRVDKEVRDELAAITDDKVKPRGPSFLKWLQAELPEDMVDLLTVNRKMRKGLRWWTEKRQSTDKGVRARLLEEMEDRTGVDHLRRAMELYDEANKAAVHKYKAARNRITDQGVIKGAYIFNGASTGRFSSTGIQMHNLLRATAKDPELLLHQLKTLPYAVIPEQTGYSINRGLSLSVRPGIMADEGACLAWCDLSAIEARVLPWLADDPEAEAVLDLFRRGEDVYVAEAAGIYGLPVEQIDKAMRQVGKVAILSLGFGGANGALMAMARNYGVTLSEAEAAYIVAAWRRKNAWAPRLWKRLMSAALDALAHPGTTFPAGRVSYVYAPGVLGSTLFCLLPSGRFIAYPQARVAVIERYERKLEAIVYAHPVYGVSVLATTVLAENITQAEAASVLRGALVEATGAGLTVIGHTHDELLIEEDEEVIDERAAMLQRIMTTVPAWATGLPLAAEAEVGFRYKVPAG